MRIASYRQLAVKCCLVVVSLASASFAMAEGGTIADIQKRGRLTVGTEAAYEPYEFIENGKVTGYGRDLLEIMAAKLKVKLNQQNLPFQGLLPGLMAKRFDFVGTSVGITEERGKRFAYTHPIGVVHTVFVVNAKNTTITKPADALGKKVATQMGSLAQPMVQAFEKDLKAKNGGRGFASLRLFQSYPDVATALQNGTIDVGVLPDNVVAVQMKKRPGSLKVIGEVGEPRLLAWVTHPNDPEIRAFINKTLEELAASGKLAQLQKKWFGKTMNLPTKGYLPKGAR